MRKLFAELAKKDKVAIAAIVLLAITCVTLFVVDESPITGLMALLSIPAASFSINDIIERRENER